MPTRVPLPAHPKLSLPLGFGSVLSLSQSPAYVPRGPRVPYPYCNIPHIVFLTKATIRASWGTWWDRGPVGWLGLEDFVIFLKSSFKGVQQQGAISPLSMVTMFVLLCFFLFLCSGRT